MLSFTIGKSTISIFVDGAFFSIDDSHANYSLLLDELRKPADERDLDAIRGLVTIKRMIERLTVGRVTITDAEVLFEGSKIGNYLAERMLELMNDGIDIEPYAAFMNNVMDNPAGYVHDELYQWMEKAKLPITPDGCFLAFKKVRADFKDCYTGMFDNSPGTILEMSREYCDTNRHNHCSSGFHFCSPDYLKSFGGQRVVVVKINPRDVTSIPSDYRYTKGRCCRYEVVAELTKESVAYHEAWKKGVVELENPAEFPEGILAQIKLPSPVLNEPVQADGDPADDVLDALVEEAEKLGLYDRVEESCAAVEAEQTDAGSVIPLVPSIAPELVYVNTVPLPDLTANECELVFETQDGRSFSASVVTAALEDASIRGAARNLGIQDSTLRGWKKKLGL